MPKSTRMDRESADRVTRAAENGPESKPLRTASRNAPAKPLTATKGTSPKIGLTTADQLANARCGACPHRTPPDP